MALDSRQFLTRLEDAVSAQSITIIGFPDACVRLLRELRDPYASNAVIADLVKREPGLTKRVVLMANSAAYRSATGPATDAKAAVARVGLAALRTVVLAYAFTRLKELEIYRDVSSRMGEIWTRGVVMSSISRVLLGTLQGRRTDREIVSLSGLLSGVGQIYILTEAAPHPEVLVDFAAVEHLLATWGGRMTRKLLSSWSFSPDIVEAACNIDRARGSGADDLVADILYVSSIFADLKGDSEELARKLQVCAPAMRLGINTVDPATIFKAAEEEAASMHGAVA
jgi:HD-like signal output (HDOD) protein